MPSRAKHPKKCEFAFHLAELREQPRSHRFDLSPANAWRGSEMPSESEKETITVGLMMMDVEDTLRICPSLVQSLSSKAFLPSSCLVSTQNTDGVPPFVRDPRRLTPRRGMWWGRRDALCRIAAAALWTGGSSGRTECAVWGALSRKRPWQKTGARPVNVVMDTRPFQ